MQPTEPAAIASLPVRPRVFYEERLVASAFVMLASLGFAWVASLFAGYARASWLHPAPMTNLFAHRRDACATPKE